MKPFGSESDDILPGISEERFLRAARNYARSAYPNPGRLGCPGSSRLEAIARRKHFPKQDESDHIATCSPCFIEYESIRKSWKRRRAAIIGTTATAALAIVAGGAILLFTSEWIRIPNIPATKSIEIANETARTRTVDLRPYETVRGEASRPSELPIVLERDKWDLLVQLPVGSEEGEYFFELTDTTGNRRVEASARAVINNYITNAKVRFDLRGLAPGRFTLTVHREGVAAPAAYPVEVR